MPRCPQLGAALALAAGSLALPLSPLGAQSWRELVRYDALVAELGGAPPVRFGEVVFVPAADSSWRYRKGTSEASSPTDAWRDPGFAEDASWLTGQTPVGYGDGDDNTELTDMQGGGGYTSVYLRREFTVAPGEIPARLLLRVYVDDGAVVWINGVEVARLHVGSGFLAHDDTASSHEAEWEEVVIADPGSVLLEGINLLAVHALNQNPGSSDFSIDAELVSPALRVSHVEAASGTDYLPEAFPSGTPGVGDSYSGSGAFAGEVFRVRSVDPELTYAASGHAATVGSRMYNGTSVAPALSLVDCFYAGGWLEGDALRTDSPLSAPRAEGNVLQNHSWIVTSEEATTVELLDIVRRQDYAIDRDGFVCVAGLNNGSGSAVPAVFGTCYNAITVGLTNGNHSRGGTPAAYDGPGRIKPEIVSPDGATSFSTGQVSSAAALLMGCANAAGWEGGFRPEVVKAVLMAGASKSEFPGWTRSATQPIDAVFGAGELDVMNSYHILQGGPATAGAAAGRYGWVHGSLDAGGASTYTLAVGSAVGEFSAVLTWHRKIDAALFLGDPIYADSLPDLELQLHRLGGGAPELLDSSDSPLDNVEHVYLRGLAPGNYTLTVSGDLATEFGLAWRADPAPLPSFTMAATGAEGDDLSFDFAGTAAGKTYLLESSPDLATWTTEHSFTGGGPVPVWVVADGREEARRFFRLTWNPVN